MFTQRFKAEFLPLLEIRENWKALFQSGKSQGIWQFFKKSGNFDHLNFFYTFHNFSCVLAVPIIIYFWGNSDFTTKIPLFLCRIMFSHA